MPLIYAIPFSSFLQIVRFLGGPVWRDWMLGCLVMMTWKLCLKKKKREKEKNLQKKQNVLPCTVYVTNCTFSVTIKYSVWLWKPLACVHRLTGGRAFFSSFFEIRPQSWQKLFFGLIFKILFEIWNVCSVLHLIWIRTHTHIYIHICICICIYIYIYMYMYIWIWIKLHILLLPTIYEEFCMLHPFLSLTGLTVVVLNVHTFYHVQWL